MYFFQYSIYMKSSQHYMKFVHQGERCARLGVARNMLGILPAVFKVLLVPRRPHMQEHGRLQSCRQSTHFITTIQSFHPYSLLFTV